MRTTRLLSTLAVLALLGGLMAAPSLAAPSTQGGNLLQDPSFEQAASGNWKWQWWYYENLVYNDDKKKELNPNESFRVPSFAPTSDELKWDKESNGTSGSAGAVKGAKWTKFHGGFY